MRIFLLSWIFYATNYVSRSIAGGYGDRNSGGSDGMVTQEDTIFVSGMDPSISEEEICQHFGAIGVIKVCFYIVHVIVLCDLRDV